MSELPNNQSNHSLEDEISIKDIIDFLSESWKSIFAVGVIGLLVALAFVWVTPSQYEATAQIKMAQIDAGNNTNPLGVNLEEPNTLIARLKMPSAYSPEEIKACNLANSQSPGESMVGLANISAVNGTTSIVKLKIRSESKEQAVACAQGIYEGIRESQSQIMNPYIEKARILLLKYQVRLQDVQALIARADKPGSALSVAYLANRDELRFLSDESIRLNAIITSGDTRHAKLISPIYASDTPVLPKKKLSLVIGLLAGLFLGLLFALIRKAWRNYQAKP
jgi:capsular polysaccharide biosynthesis protein